MNTDNTTLFEEVLQSGETPSKVLKRLNIQIRPSKVRVELNDKQTRTIFKLSNESTNDLLNNDTFEIVEKRDDGFSHGSLPAKHRIGKKAARARRFFNPLHLICSCGRT